MQEYSSRLEVLEKFVQQLQRQLETYVTTKENDIQLRNIKETVDQIKKEIHDLQLDMKSQFDDIDTKLVRQSFDTQKYHSELKENQDKLLIQVLTYVVGTMVTIGALIFVGYITHFFH